MMSRQQALTIGLFVLYSIALVLYFVVPMPYPVQLATGLAVAALAILTFITAWTKRL